MVISACKGRMSLEENGSAVISRNDYTPQRVGVRRQAPLGVHVSTHRCTVGCPELVWQPIYRKADGSPLTGGNAMTNQPCNKRCTLYLRAHRRMAKASRVGLKCKISLCGVQQARHRHFQLLVVGPRVHWPLERSRGRGWPGGRHLT